MTRSLKTRLLSVVLTFVLVFSMIPLSTFADSDADTTDEPVAAVEAEKAAESDKGGDASSDSGKDADKEPDKASDKAPAPSKDDAADDSQADDAVSSKDDAGDDAEAVTEEQDEAGLSAMEAEEPEEPVEEETIDVPVRIVWDDYDDENDLRPTSVAINLVDQSGTVVAKAKVTDDGDANHDVWTYTFKDVAAGTYTIKQPTRINLYNTEKKDGTTYPSYSKSDGTLTVTNYLPCVTVSTFTASFSDLSDYYGKRPTKTFSVDFKGTYTYWYDESGKFDRTTKTFIRSNVACTITEMSGNTATGTLSKPIHLPLLYTDWISVSNKSASSYATVPADGFPGVYKASSTKYYPSSSDVAKLYFSIDTVATRATITWDDDKNTSGARPSKVTLKTYDGDELLDTRTITTGASSGSTTSSSATLMLPKYSLDGNRELAIKQVIEGMPSYYELTEDADSTAAQSRWTATLEDVDFSASVVWEDNDNARENRPASVNLFLYANGEKYWGSNQGVTLSAGNDWTYTWTSLPKVDDEGNEIVYSVRESALPIHSIEYAYFDEEGDPIAEGEEGIPASAKVTNVLQDDWTYALQLEWDTNVVAEKYDRTTVTTGTDTYTNKYKLNISTNSAEYEVGQLEVRLPYYLWQERDGTWVAPSEISLPKAPATNPQYSFNYTIDTHGTADKSDDEIVFTNWKYLEAGTNQTLTVVYKNTAWKDYDMSTATFQATGYGVSTLQENQDEPEVKQSAKISYTIDTGLYISSLSKTCKVSSTGDHDLLYAWPASGTSTYGGKTEAAFDPDNYNYVRYTYNYDGRADQPNKLTFTDVTGGYGEVVCVTNGSSTGVGVPFTTAMDKETGLTTTTWSLSYTDSSRSGFDEGYLGNEHYYNWGYIIVRYPREEKAAELGYDLSLVDTSYTNDITLDATALDNDGYDNAAPDQNDVATATAGCSVEWHDYEAVLPSGEWSLSKGLAFTHSHQSTEQKYDGFGVTELSLGVDVPFRFFMSQSLKAYDMCDEYYFDLYDSNMYWGTTSSDDYGSLTRMTDEDYYLTGGYLYYNFSDVNRKNGKTEYPTIDGVFEIYGQVNDGEWELITTVTPRNGGCTCSFDIPADKNYTGLKIRTPKVEGGYLSLSAYGKGAIKSSSPTAQKWIDDGATKIYLRNIDTGLIQVRYEGDEDFTWFNPDESGSANAAAKALGLTSYDASLYGKAAAHADRDGYLESGTYSNSIVKKTLGYTSDAVTSTVDAEFGVYAYEGIQIDLPDEAKRSFSMDEGTFYDLLPLGYTYKKGSATARGAGSSSSYYRDATVTSVETINDYHGTGRQMVIFHVESLVGDGNNVSKGISMLGESSSSISTRYDLTGFTINYHATIAWESLTYNRSGKNYVAFQGDREFISKAYNESGQNASGKTSYSYPTDVKTDDGTPVYYDVNGNGSSSDNDTLYSYSTINPNIATSIETGLSKAVRGNSGIYQKSDETVLDGSYSYRVGVTMSDGGTTDNVIIYDILEDAANTGGASGEESWKGTLDYVDVSLAKTQGIAPVIYYSTVKGLDYNDFDPDKDSYSSDTASLDPAIWTTEMPADKSTITAIAVDLRHDAAGDDFVFEGNSTASIEIYMTAPGQVPLNDEGDPIVYAYNRASYSSSWYAAGTTEASNHYNIGKRVEIKLGVAIDYSFKKVGATWDKDQEAFVQAPLRGARFALYPLTCTNATHSHTDSCWSTYATATVASKADGTVTFEDLTTGDYRVKELSTVTGYVAASGTWQIRVNAETGAVYSVKSTMGDSLVIENAVTTDEGTVITDAACTVVNTQKFVKDLDIHKTWNVDDKLYDVPESVSFNIYQTRAGSSSSKVLYQTVSMPYGFGKSIQVGHLPAYDAQGNAYSYAVEELPIEGYTVSLRTFSSGGLYYDNTYQYGGLTLIKRVNSADTVSAGVATVQNAQFDIEVTLKDADGNLVNGTFPTKVGTTYGPMSSDVKPDTEKAGEDVTFVDGKATVSLGLGQVVRILNLPLGYKYSTKELLGEDSGWSLVSQSSNASGTIGYTGKTIFFTNKYDRQTVDIPVTKVWDDEDDAIGERPESIKVQLYLLNTAYKVPTFVKVGSPVELNAENGWTYTFANQLKYSVKIVNNVYTADEYVYKVEEVSDVPANYQAPVYAGSPSEGFTVTNVAKKATATLQATKLWHRDDTCDATGTFSFTLTGCDESGKALEGDASENIDLGTGFARTAETDTYDASGKATVDFGEITYLKAGTYYYVMDEVAGDETGVVYDETTYMARVTVSDDLEATVTYGTLGDDGFVPLGLGESATFENYWKGTTEVSVEKVWDDDDDAVGIRPASVTVVLTKDGEDTDETLVLDESTGWKGTFENLDAHCLKDGTYADVAYGVREVTDVDELAHYAATITGSVDEGFVVTNAISGSAWAQIAFTKYFEGEDPDDFVFALIASDAQGNQTGTTETKAETINGKEFLLDEGDGTFMHTVTIQGANAEGVASAIPLIRYATAGDYCYVLQEVAGTNEKVDYDASVYLVHVNVSSDFKQVTVAYQLMGEDGTLTDVDADQVSFHNAIVPDLVPEGDQTGGDTPGDKGDEGDEGTTDEKGDKDDKDDDAKATSDDDADESGDEGIDDVKNALASTGDVLLAWALLLAVGLVLSGGVFVVARRHRKQD